MISGTYKEIEEGKSYTFNGYTLTRVEDEDLQKEIGAKSKYFYRYTNDKADSYYIKESTFEEIYEKMKEAGGEYYCTSEQYIKTTGKKTKYEEIKDATFDSDSSGRLVKIHYKKTIDEGTQDVDKDLTMTEVQDTTGYDEAMQEYYYKKAVYDKTIEDINSKTAMIQQQDRALELRLKQLDTEQKALSNELEAVKSVIQKNVEATFKTFQA